MECFLFLKQMLGGMMGAQRADLPTNKVICRGLFAPKNGTHEHSRQTFPNLKLNFLQGMIGHLHKVF